MVPPAATGSVHGPSQTGAATLSLKSSSGGLDEGAKIGIGVGVSLGVLFLGAAAVAGFLLGRMSSRKDGVNGEQSYHGYDTT